MSWLAYSLLILLYAGAFVGGYALSKKNRKAGLITGGVSLALVLTFLVFRYFPVIEFVLFPFHAYVYIRPWWCAAFGFFLFGVGVHQIEQKRTQRAVAGFAAVLLLYMGYKALATAALDPASLTGTPDPQTGACKQTTGYTCGAAASASLLAQLGVPATESEMAMLCGTNYMTGTDEFGAVYGLNAKLAEKKLRAELTTYTWEDLQDLTHPAMVTIKHSFLVDHWVTVFKTDENSVTIADPLIGKVIWSKELFESRRRNVLIKVSRQ